MRTLKTIMAAAAIASTVMFTGCEKELPTPEKMKTIATVVGTTAGYACELSKTKESVKEAIMTVLDIAVKVVPAEDQTFTEAWAPIIDAELQKLVEAGKIDASGAALAKVALNAATNGIDYLFVKYPKAKAVKELVSVAVEGFVDGYKSVVTARNADVKIDDEALKYIKDKMAASN